MACLTQRDCGEDKGKYDRSKDEEGDEMPPVAVRLAMLSTELLLLPLMPPHTAAASSDAATGAGHQSTGAASWRQH